VHSKIDLRAAFTPSPSNDITDSSRVDMFSERRLPSRECGVWW